MPSKAYDLGSLGFFFFFDFLRFGISACDAPIYSDPDRRPPMLSRPAIYSDNRAAAPPTFAAATLPPCAARHAAQPRGPASRANPCVPLPEEDRRFPKLLETFATRPSLNRSSTGPTAAAAATVCGRWPGAGGVYGSTSPSMPRFLSEPSLAATSLARRLRKAFVAVDEAMPAGSAVGVPAALRGY